MSAPLRGEVEEALHEALAVHEILRRLRFSPDDIYLILPESGEVGVLLKAEDKTFCVVLLPAELREGVSNEDITARWAALATRYNTDKAFALSVYMEAHAPRNGTKIITGILNAGFRPRWAHDANDALRIWNKPTTLLA